MKSLLFKVIILIAFIFGMVSHYLYVHHHMVYNYLGIKYEVPQTHLEKIKAKKRLDVVILDSPTVYVKGNDEHQGFEYDLLRDYSKHIGVELNLTVVHTVKEALELTRKGIGDLTSASLSIDPERAKEFQFGPYFHTVQEELICHNGLYEDNLIPKSKEDLHKLKIVIGKNTSAEKTLELLKDEMDDFNYSSSNNLSSQDLLEKVWKKEYDCTVTDTHIFSISQRYYPELVSTIKLTPKLHLSWILRQGDTSLKESLYYWFNEYERSGKMSELHNFYYGFLQIFDYYDTKVFYRRIKTILPKYEDIFKNAGKKYNIPWIILAAQSYQESHWNPRAKSFTGVRGMMMLTNDTAKLLGVKNRLSAKQSIYGGAKYIDMLRKEFPKNLEGKNLWAFTLAAYNVGLGHIHDAQSLTMQLNKNPYSWNDLKTVLPLLSEKKYYKNLKYGYARGNEPVHYVDAIQHYYDILVKHELEKVAQENSNGAKK
jgi:membrane-bound lytic murein transglycosylase F